MSWFIGLLLFAATIVSVSCRHDYASSSLPPPNQNLGNEEKPACRGEATYPDSNSVVLIEEQMAFRRIKPMRNETNVFDFFLLETEVTNDMYARYLRATGKTKGDFELVAAQERLWKSKNYRSSSASPVYDFNNPALLWRGNIPPGGLGNYPVALITIGDAKAFCEWLTLRYAHVGRFRLPTADEWVFAAYGESRNYPWGNVWNVLIPCVSSRNEIKKSPCPVGASTKDRTPDGIYDLWGNVREYVTDLKFRSDTRFMGASFERFAENGSHPFTPKNDYWGYVHNSESRMEDTGFRVALQLDSASENPKK